MKVLVIGAGYVGLPLAVAAAKGGALVWVYDCDRSKLDCIARGQSYIDDVEDEDLDWVAPDYSIERTSECDVVVICVPTPLGADRAPDTSAIFDVAVKMQPHLKKSTLVILESTVYPGFTRKVLAPLVGDVLAFSPERIDPGNLQWTVTTTPKLVAGLTPEALEQAVRFYRMFVDEVVTTETVEVAEMSKLLENTFRAVNIAFINEMALCCASLGINARDVITAASTKPFGFMPFYPGPGIGGHCIPVDPMYLDWALHGAQRHSEFISLATRINESMPAVVATKIQRWMGEEGHLLTGACVVLCGVAYKPGSGDVREAPSLDLVRCLRGYGADVWYLDPHVSSLVVDGKPVPEALDAEGALCAIIVTDHPELDYVDIVDDAQFVFDTRGVLPAHDNVRFL